jgi:N-acetylneuraminate lyase
MPLFTPLTGFIAATFTPTTPDGALNLEQVAPLVDHLVRNGIAGLYVLGSTGEGVLFTFAERCAAAEAFVRAAAGRIPVIVQVGHESAWQARELAAHAQSIGATAISAVSSVYFKPDSLDALLDTMAQIAAGAPELPYYYYHIPQLTGLSFSMLELLARVGDRIPTLRGIKFTSPRIDELQTCIDWAGERYEVLFGVDEMVLSGLVAGAQGAVGSTYNFAAPLYRRLWNAWQAQDLAAARRYQSQAQAIVNTFKPYGSLAAQKAIMSMLGIDCGPTRLPVRALSADAVAALRSDLAALGFFEWLRDE